MSARTLLILSLLAFSATTIEGRTVSGTVYAEADTTAIEGADCRLIANGKFITATATDAKGNFTLSTDAKASLTLTISLTGYAPTEIIVESGAKNVATGPLFLAETTTLSEVTVNATAMTDSRGRTIVYPSQTDCKISPNSVSLLQKLPLPGLTANPITRSLSVDGGAPYILIDGVPSSLTDFNALNPKDIARIEYSRITPARYADKGASGLLSITLRQRTDGGQIYTYGRSAVNTAFVDATIRASYHQAKSQFALYYTPSWRNYQSVYDNTWQEYIGNDFRVNLEEHDRAPFNYFTNDIKAKYDYAPSQSTLLSVTFNAGTQTNAHRTIAETTDSYLGQYASRNTSSGKDFAPSLDVFLRHDFNERNSLEAQIVGTLSSSDYRRHNRYIYPSLPEDSYIMDVDSRRRSLISEISYIHTFSQNTSLSGGYQNTVSHSTNRYLTTDYRPLLTENNNYIYARLGQQIGKVYLSVSTGAKMFWTNNDRIRRHFIRNLSSASASWRINELFNLQGSFNYSPSIPSLSALTDYPQQTSPYLISNGNPDLKVADNFRYTLSGSFNKGIFSASAYASFTDVRHSVVSDLTYLGDRMFLSRSENSSRHQMARGNLSFTLNQIAGFGANLSLDYAHYHTAGNQWKHNLGSFSGDFALWWTNSTFTVSYWRNIPGKYLSGHYVGKEENGDSFGVYYTGKHWNFGAEWMYMFDGKGTRYPRWSYSPVNPCYRERHISDNANMIVLSVSYSADFGSIFRTARRNLHNTEKSSSLLKL